MEGVVSKGEFARLANVSPGRVSQWISEGKISPSALVGEGRTARINVDQARADLRLKLDVSQRFGNGLSTVLDGPPAVPTQAAPPPVETGIDYEIKQQKLEQIRRMNRSAAIKEQETKGSLTETAAVRGEMMRIAGTMLGLFEGAIADFATAISAEYKIPQRDVVHLLRRKMRDVRDASAKAMKKQAMTLDETVETEIVADTIETIN